mmetsp:Transcript_3185/g.5073  ORF Transcript_3185/g.5073 Transcript_3185/m.5073 type:complete len:84 (+) Transcript_3185:91-342(+)
MNGNLGVEVYSERGQYNIALSIVDERGHCHRSLSSKSIGQLKEFDKFWRSLYPTLNKPHTPKLPGMLKSKMGKMDRINRYFKL